MTVGWRKGKGVCRLGGAEATQKRQLWVGGNQWAEGVS